MTDIRAIAAPSTNLRIERLAPASPEMERRRATCRHARPEVLTVEEETRTLFAEGAVSQLRARRVVTRERGVPS